MLTFFKKMLKTHLSVDTYRKLQYYYYRFIVNKGITPLPRFWNTNNRYRYEWFKLAAFYLHVNRLDGVYAEFGCHEVSTFRFALNTLGRPGECANKIFRFYAFDSFEGMPEPAGIDRQKIWRKGMNRTAEEEFKEICKRDLNRITIVKGFYNHTLSHYKWDNNHQIVLAYIDCDYYSSTVPVLKFLKDKLAHGALVVFDDFNCYYGDPLRGEKRAFYEFKEEIKDIGQFEPFLPVSMSGMSFIFLKKEFLGKDVL